MDKFLEDKENEKKLNDLKEK